MELVLSVCDRFRCLPSQALKEPADVLRMMAIEALVRPQEGGY